MLSFDVQIEGRFHQRNRPADAAISVLAANFVQRSVNIGPALGFLLLWE